MAVEYTELQIIGGALVSEGSSFQVVKDEQEHYGLVAVAEDARVIIRFERETIIEWLATTLKEMKDG